MEAWSAITSLLWDLDVGGIAGKSVTLALSACRWGARIERAAAPASLTCDSRPADLESAALPVELAAHGAEPRYDVPDCTANRETGCRVVPAATGSYRDIRANMEQTWRRSFAEAADTVRNRAW